MIYIIIYKRIKLTHCTPYTVLYVIVSQFKIFFKIKIKFKKNNDLIIPTSLVC